MSKAEKQTAGVKVAPMPGWINDKNNQAEWNGRFIRILNRDYKNLDAVICAILNDKALAQICTVKIRSYVDQEVTRFLNEQRKARGAKHKKQLESATAGLRAAIDLYTERGDRATAMYLGTIAVELSGALGRCKDAYATKRHGRDRAHSILSECRAFLESELGRPVSCGTLANLLTAGYEADGTPPEEPITEERVRKNLAHFKSNNPLWRNDLDPLFEQYLVNPPTK